MKHQERGYILVITLLLMAVASLALIQVSRASLLKALVAKSAQQALQRRWGAMSCQSALLSQAESILKQAEEKIDEPVVTTRIAMTLGGQTFELVISDEQAKANIESLYERRGRQTTESNIRSLIRQSRDPAAVRLKPINPNASVIQSRASLPVLGSFGQIFTNATAQQIVGTREQSETAATYFTCWGSGKLNFRRASQEALKQVCEGVITDNQIDRLMTARQDTSLEGMDDILNQLALTKTKKDQLTKLFTDKSSCHSLWVVMRDANRTWHRLIVSESATSNQETGTDDEPDVNDIPDVNDTQGTNEMRGINDDPEIGGVPGLNGVRGINDLQGIDDESTSRSDFATGEAPSPDDPSANRILTFTW